MTYVRSDSQNPLPRGHGLRRATQKQDPAYNSKEACWEELPLVQAVERLREKLEVGLRSVVDPSSHLLPGKGIRGNRVCMRRILLVMVQMAVHGPLSVGGQRKKSVRLGWVVGDPCRQGP